MTTTTILNNPYLRTCREEATDTPPAGEGTATPPAAPATPPNPTLSTPAETITPPAAAPPEPPPAAASEKAKDETEQPYEIKFADTFSGDDALRGLINEKAKECGLPADKLAEFINGIDSHLSGADTQARQEAEAAAEEANRKLQQDWGSQYMSRRHGAIATASRICAEAGIPVSVFSDLGIDDNPAMFRLMDAMGRMLGESPLIAPTASAPSSREEAYRINSDPKHPLYAAFHNPNHPDFHQAHDTYNRLSGIIR